MSAGPIYHVSGDSPQQKAARVSAANRRRRAEDAREREERHQRAMREGRPIGHHEECGCESCAQAPAVDRHEKVKTELADLHVRWRNEQPFGSDEFVLQFLRSHRPKLHTWDLWALWENYDELITKRDGLADGSVHWSQVIGEDATGDEFELQAADAIEADIDGLVAEIAGGAS